LRDDDERIYLDTLRSLLNEKSIRFHIKLVVFAVLEQLKEPKEEEWEIIAPLINGSDKTLKFYSWIILRGSISWFKLLDSLDLIKQWLNYSDEELVDEAFNLLLHIQKPLSERVAKLVEPYIVGKDEIWKNRLYNLITWTDVGASRVFLEFFIKLIDEGILDDISDFWKTILFLHNEQPEWTCEVIKHYMERRLSFST